ncbi:MAG: SGNH/GDSL hydrolase family protein [Candidatus Rokuibacteriota bacterium]
MRSIVGRPSTCGRLLRFALLALVATACGGGNGGAGGIVTATSTNPRVTAIGDSITAGMGEVPYPRRLETALRRRNPEARVNNRGQGGQQTSGGIGTLTHALATDAPGFVTILEGTNDITAGASAEQIAENLRHMVQLAVGSGVVPVLGTLPPQFGARARFMDRVVEVNARIREVAAQERVALADVFQALPDASFFSDGLHPNNQGSGAIAEAFDAALARAGYPAAMLARRRRP